MLPNMILHADVPQFTYILCNQYMYLLVYLVCIIIVVIVIFFAYTRIKYRFWSIQPVNKWYNITYKFMSPQVIDYSLPSINKYVNIINITTRQSDELDDSQRKIILELIVKNLLRSEKINYLPTIENIFPYIEHSTQPGYVSIYNEQNLYNKSVRNEITYNDCDNKLVAIVTSRPMYINIKGVGQFMTYYMDNLTVADGYKKSEYIPKMIQTHLYQTRKKNVVIHSALFKHNKKPKLIVPLVRFYISCYSLKDITVVPYPHPKYRMLELSQDHIALVKEFLTQQCANYKCMVYPDISNILNLIKTKNIFLYGTFHETKLISLFVFRDTATTYNTSNSTVNVVTNKYVSSNIILCVASIVLPTYANLLYNGFSLAIKSISKKQIGNFICIESTSENKKIILVLKRSCREYFREESSFFLYNYVSPKFLDTDCVFIY